MGALGWEIDREQGLVVVSGVGLFNLAFLVAYRQAMQAEGAVGYRKLFDLHRSDIQLSPDALEDIADGAHVNALTAGPIAIVMGREPPPLLLDMAILLKHRMGTSRRVRLFTDEADARRWLASESIAADPAPLRPAPLPSRPPSLA